MPDRSRPRDPNQLAHQVFLESIGEAKREQKPVDPAKNPHAVALGRMGGLKGGVARAAALTPKKRSQIAAKASAARWGKKKQGALALETQVDPRKQIEQHQVSSQWESNT
jgi:hypothetical protein